MDDSTVNTAFGFFGLSALAAVCRVVLSESGRTIAGFFRALVLALFAGIIAALFLQDYSLSIYTQAGIVAGSAFIADYILLFVMATAKKLSSDPKVVWDFFAKRFVK